MSEKEEERLRRPILFMPIPIPDIYGFLIRYWPRGYEDSLKHLLNANIEFLKAIDSAINQRIKQLEIYSEELRKARLKEKN